MKDKVWKFLENYGLYVFLAAIIVVPCLLIFVIDGPPQRVPPSVEKTQRSPHVNRYGQPCAAVQFSGPMSFIDCQNRKKRANEND